jgi:hypothetical protein
MKRTIVIGGGPAGFGPLVCALQRGQDKELLERGVVWLERGSRLGGGALGDWDIDSDTLPEVLLESIEKAPALRDLLEHGLARKLSSYRGGSFPLPLAAEFLDVVGERLATLVSGTHSEVHSGTNVEKVTREDDGTYAVLAQTKEGPQTFRAESVVYALGGYHLVPDGVTVGLLDLPAPGTLPDGRTVMTAGTLFETNGRAVFKNLAASRPKIAIVGGSHSAFAAAEIVLQELRDRLDPGAVRILARERPRLAYPSLAAAHADGYMEANEKDVCPETSRVNRLAGLRLGRQELLRRVWGLGGTEKERRVEILPYSPAGFEDADLVILAIGFSANTVPYYRGSERVLLNAERGNGARLVDQESRLLDAEGHALPDAWGIGMGSGYVPRGEPSFRGQTNGLWLYQNDTGAVIVDAILQRSSHK